MERVNELSGPWYREPWPWLVMSGPAAVLLAGAVTMWLAFAGADGLVADDYYRQGLAINRRLARDEAAAAQGIVLRVEPSARGLRLHLEGRLAPPEALFVHLAHATRAGHDLRLRLAHRGAGVYEAERPALAAGHWRVAVEDPRGAWRVAGDWMAGDAVFTLRAATAPR